MQFYDIENYQYYRKKKKNGVKTRKPIGNIYFFLYFCTLKYTNIV